MRRRWPEKGTIKGHSRGNIAERIVGTRRVKGNAEVLAQGREFEVAGSGLVRELGKVPQRPLKSAKHMTAGGQEEAKPFIPSPKKLAVECGIVSYQLRHLVVRSCR